MENRIPFDIKYRPDIEVGKYLVKTRDDRPVRVVCWDKKDCYHYPIVALIQNNEYEIVSGFTKEGAYGYNTGESTLDLFLVANPDYKEPTTTCSTSVDWVAFRRVAAKDILCALITSDMAGAPEEKSRWSIDAADELIKQLKEEKNGLH